MKINCFGAFVDCDVFPENSQVFFRHVFITNGKVQSLDITLSNVPARLIQKAKERIESSPHESDSILYGQVYENIYCK